MGETLTSMMKGPQTGVRMAMATLLRPIDIVRAYQVRDLPADALAGLTVAIVLLPQAMAYAYIAELPPQMGLYTAIVAALVGALWGSSSHLHTGPTNAKSLLVLSVILPLAVPGTAEYMLIAGMVAVLSGLMCLLMGWARLGFLTNFISDSVIVGFTAGAGALIAIYQLPHLLGLNTSASQSAGAVLVDIAGQLTSIHLPTLALGVGTVLVILLVRKINPKWPGPLIGLIAASAVVGILGLDQAGVAVVGELPRGLPPIAHLRLLDLNLLGQLSTGALALSLIGLAEAVSIARGIASQSGERLDSNQEFVGQGLANIACGIFSGYPCSGSFTRSAVNYQTGARTPIASALSGAFVLGAMLLLAPFTRYVPRGALAGVLIWTAYGMIDRKKIARIWRGARADAAIMVVTLAATLLLPLQFAILSGVLLSLGYYAFKTSMPDVRSVLPDASFRHLTYQPQRAGCPQLAVVDILGDLYFGAVHHVEENIRQLLAAQPRQRLLLLRMQRVQHCDLSGIEMLENLLALCRERGGDLYLVRVQPEVLELMRSTGFLETLGADHILPADAAVSVLFHHVMDPALCVYECDERVFEECQSLPRAEHLLGISLADAPAKAVPSITPRALWDALHGDPPPTVIDVRDPQEFGQGHIPGARSLPLPRLLADRAAIPTEGRLVLVCRGGRRSTRVTSLLQESGWADVVVLEGGMLAWEAAGLLEAVEPAGETRPPGS
jgi:sulfate permease, SulP family